MSSGQANPAPAPAPAPAPVPPPAPRATTNCRVSLKCVTTTVLVTLVVFVVVYAVLYYTRTSDPTLSLKPATTVSLIPIQENNITAEWNVGFSIYNTNAYLPLKIKTIEVSVVCPWFPATGSGATPVPVLSSPGVSIGKTMVCGEFKLRRRKERYMNAAVTVAMPPGVIQAAQDGKGYNLPCGVIFQAVVKRIWKSGGHRVQTVCGVLTKEFTSPQQGIPMEMLYCSPS